MAMFFEVLLRMTQAYYFPKQNVDFENLSDVTKDVLFNEFKKEKYSNIFKPFFNKIKDEFISALKNIYDIKLYTTDNQAYLNYEDNKFSFIIDSHSYFRVNSSFFYNELLTKLSSQSPFKFFSQKDLETGLSNSYSLSLSEPISRDTNSGLIDNINDIENIIIKTPLLNNICNTVIKSDSLCTFFKYDKSSNNLNLLKSNIGQYIKDQARNISLNKIKVIENHLQENINKKTLDFINKNISLTFNNIMFNIINNAPTNSSRYIANAPDALYNQVYYDLCKKVKSTSSNDDNIIYVYEQNVNEFISSDYLGCKTSTEFINEWCDNLQLPLKVSRIFPNIVIDENDKSNTKVFPTCQDAQDFMLDYLEPWLDDHNKIQDRDPDRLYEKAKQYLELSSNLNEKTLPDLEQSFNKIKGFSTNQSQPKEAKKTKTAGFHL